MTDTGPVGTPGFAEACRIVGEGVRFLQGRFGARGVAAQTGRQDLTDHVAAQFDALTRERPDRLRVIVLGEFKAGKSSLINSLVGRTVAATDVGELTAAVCRIVPAGDAPERVILRGAAGSPDLGLTIPEFLAATIAHGAASRMGRPSALDGYDSAVLSVRTELPVELVDTPGLGAARANERAAMDALIQADIALLTVDCDNLGGARDTALMERLRATGQPLVVAVTKADLLGNDEIDEVLEFVSGTYQAPRSRVFAVTTLRAEGTRGDGGSDLMSDGGLNALRGFLVGAAPARAALRDAALLAQARDLAAELAVGLEAVAQAAELALQDVSDNAAGDQAVAEAVTRHICEETAALVRQKLLAEAEGILEGRLHNRATRLTEQDLSAVMAQSVERLDTRQFWEALKTRLEGRYQREWSEGVRRQLAALNESLEHHRREMKEEASTLSDALAREEHGRLERKKTAVETAVAAGVTGVAMLATGFPLLLAAVAVAPAVWAYYQNKALSQQESSLDEVRYAARLAVSAWVDEYVREAVADFGAELLRENRSVARMASEAYGRARPDFPGTPEELAGLVRAARRHLSDLSALTSGERLLTGGA